MTPQFSCKTLRKCKERGLSTKIPESKDLFCSVFNKTVKSTSSIIDVATAIFFQNSDKVLRKRYLYKSIAGPKHIFCRVFNKTLAFGSFLHDVGITLSFQNDEKVQRTRSLHENIDEPNFFQKLSRQCIFKKDYKI